MRTNAFVRRTKSSISLKRPSCDEPRTTIATSVFGVGLYKIARLPPAAIVYPVLPARTFGISPRSMSVFTALYVNFAVLNVIDGMLVGAKRSGYAPYADDNNFAKS